MDLSTNGGWGNIGNQGPDHFLASAEGFMQTRRLNPKRTESDDDAIQDPEIWRTATRTVED